MSTRIRYFEGIANDSRRHEGGENLGFTYLWVDALYIIQNSGTVCDALNLRELFTHNCCSFRRIS
jgi:hypothetical protein